MCTQPNIFLNRFKHLGTPIFKRPFVQLQKTRLTLNLYFQGASRFGLKTHARRYLTAKGTKQ